MNAHLRNLARQRARVMDALCMSAFYNKEDLMSNTYAITFYRSAECECALGVVEEIVTYHFGTTTDKVKALLTAWEFLRADPDKWSMIPKRTVGDTQVVDIVALTIDVG